MSFFVVDTNVPVVANGKSVQADPDCVIACVDALTAARARGVIILDDAMLILTEYRKNLNLSGQPGLGDFFMKWLWDVQADESHCKAENFIALTEVGLNIKFLCPQHVCPRK